MIRCRKQETCWSWTFSLPRSWSCLIHWDSTWGTLLLPKTYSTEDWRLWQLLRQPTRSWTWLGQETGTGGWQKRIRGRPGQFLKGWGIPSSTTLNQTVDKDDQNKLIEYQECLLSHSCVRVNLKYTQLLTLLTPNIHPGPCCKVTEEAKREIELQKERRVEGFQR